VCADGWGQSCGAALRVGDFKVIVGYPGDSRRIPLPATENLASVIAAADNVRLGLDPRDRVLMNGDGGAPGDGCEYANGTGCPCYSTPCLFNVVDDITESHDLASDPQHAATLRSLLDRLTALSSSAMPPAGLYGDMYTNDTKLQCSYVARFSLAPTTITTTNTPSHSLTPTHNRTHTHTHTHTHTSSSSSSSCISEHSPHTHTLSRPNTQLLITSMPPPTHHSKRYVLSNKCFEPYGEFIPWFNRSQT
jgi:hypothetical protein